MISVLGDVELMEQKAPVFVEFAGGRSGAGIRAGRDLFEMVLSLLIVAVSVLLFMRITYIPYYPAAVCISAVLFPLLLSYLSQKTGGLIPAVYLLCVIAAGCALFYNQLWSGCLVVANGFLAAVKFGVLPTYCLKQAFPPDKSRSMGRRP